MTDLAQHWTDTYDRVRALAQGLSSEQAEQTVPATDAWTVRQLLSHMVGVNDDALKDAVPDDLNPEWTTHHVEDRANLSPEQLLAEWDQHAPKIQEALRQGPEDEVASLVVDAWVHEQDMRSVPEFPAAGREDGAVDVTLGAFTQMGLGAACANGDCPPLRLVAEDFDTVVGDGDPAATVTAPSKWELSRGLGGRRSTDQVRAWDWDGDPEPYLAHLSPFGALRETDLQE
ncbi:maleylpyruvate isomerase family mycothiol-dependent enzyme [Nocardioidaceae bacterium]|nr:maleylpyruvate isomerase family mycothiol-dependent enzyme [Nocardioidaceae bacterium]